MGGAVLALLLVQPSGILAGPVKLPEPDRAEPQTDVLFVDVAHESGIDRPTAYLNRRVRNLL